MNMSTPPEKPHEAATEDEIREDDQQADTSQIDRDMREADMANGEPNALESPPTNSVLERKAVSERK